ncbi:NAD(P)-dependent dehydrogenase (short-subunit alcohol dehydrogenase family) [Marmoricola sp. URHA0025 HA25]
MSVAVITGGSAGLGLALARALAVDGWRVVVDGRDAERLAAAADHPDIVTVPGDVTDDWHRGALVDAAEQEGGLDLLVHNASTLGPTPLPHLADASIADLDQVWRTNVGAPMALTAVLLPMLVASKGVLVSISSDAGVEHYEGWGLYGTSKAALDHLTLTFGEENPEISAYAVDPGDMRTQMHQDAFPGEDISDRPLPETVVPHFLALLADRPPSGRYRAAELPAVQRVGG